MATTDLCVDHADDLAELWTEFEDATRRRVSSLEDAVAAATRGGLDADTKQRAMRDAHGLAGSMGTFGLPEGSRLARRAESLLRGTAPLSGAAFVELGALTAAIRRQAEQGSPALLAAGG